MPMRWRAPFTPCMHCNRRGLRGVVLGPRCCILRPSFRHKMTTTPAPHHLYSPTLLLFLLAACGQPAERPLQGYIEGEFARVGAPFAGTLQQLSVQRGDQATKDAPLFALER